MAAGRGEHDWVCHGRADGRGSGVSAKMTSALRAQRTHVAGPWLQSREQAAPINDARGVRTRAYTGVVITVPSKREGGDTEGPRVMHTTCQSQTHGTALCAYLPPPPPTAAAAAAAAARLAIFPREVVRIERPSRETRRSLKCGLRMRKPGSARTSPEIPDRLATTCT